MSLDLLKSIFGNSPEAVVGEDLAKTANASLEALLTASLEKMPTTKQAAALPFVPTPDARRAEAEETAMEQSDSAPPLEESAEMDKKDKKEKKESKGGKDEEKSEKDSKKKDEKKDKSEKNPFPPKGNGFPPKGGFPPKMAAQVPGEDAYARAFQIYLNLPKEAAAVPPTPASPSTPEVIPPPTEVNTKEASVAFLNQQDEMRKLAALKVAEQQYNAKIMSAAFTDELIKLSQAESLGMTFEQYLEKEAFMGGLGDLLGGLGGRAKAVASGAGHAVGRVPGDLGAVLRGASPEQQRSILMALMGGGAAAAGGGGALRYGLGSGSEE